MSPAPSIIQRGKLSEFIASRFVAKRPLKEGDCIKMFDASFHYVQYVNSSGAYAVPLSSITREIQGHEINFTAGGRTISANSVVEVINPLQMGGSSPEYRRYVKMAAASKRRGTMEDIGGVKLGEFDISDTDFQNVDEESITVAGHTTGKKTKQPKLKDEADMAKKAAKKSAAKKDKAPKTVRRCACGCGGETTGYFVPGHDARLHGWVSKLADGRIDGQGKDAKSGEKIIPSGVLKSLDLVATKEGHRSKNPHFYKEA